MNVIAWYDEYDITLQDALDWVSGKTPDRLSHAYLIGYPPERFVEDIKSILNKACEYCENTASAAFDSDRFDGVSTTLDISKDSLLEFLMLLSSETRWTPGWRVFYLEPSDSQPGFISIWKDTRET